MAKQSGVPGKILVIGILVYLCSIYWWLLLVFVILAIFYFVVKSNRKVKDAPEQPHYENYAEFVDPNDSNMYDSNPQELSDLPKVTDSKDNEADNMQYDDNLKTSSEMTVIDYMNWLNSNKELEAKANEHRQQGKRDDEMLVCMLALAKLDQAHLSEDVHANYESYWKDRFDLLNGKRTEMPQLPKAPTLSSQMEKPSVRENLQLDDIDALIFHARKCLTDEAYFLPFQLLQSFCGIYQKSKSEKPLYTFLTELIEENYKNSSSEEWRQMYRVADSIVVMLQAGTSNDEILKYVKEKFVPQAQSSNAPRYTHSVNTKFLSKKREAELRGDIDEERRICQEALAAIDKGGGKGYKKYWEDSLMTLENDGLRRLEAFVVKSFNKVQDPYAQRVLSYIGSCKGLYTRNGEKDKDIFEFFIEKADHKIESSSSEETISAFTDFKKLIQKLQAHEDDEQIIEWLKKDVAKSSINYSESERKVVFWPHTYVFGADELNNATMEQRSFYQYFRKQFLSGKYIDLDGNSNYAFVLMFDLADHCTEESQLDELETYFNSLSEHYPKTQHYIDHTLDKVKERFLEKQSNEFLSNLENTEDSTTRWVKEGEEVTVAGMKLTRGNFYMGNYLSVPKENVLCYSSGSSKRNFLGPVVNPNLEAKFVENASWSSFSSYSTMTKALRFRYLSFLSGDVSLSQIEPALLCVYLMGIEYRLFVDKDTTIEEKESLVKFIAYNFANRRNITDEYGTMDIFSDLIDRALCDLKPKDFKDLIGDYPITSLKNYSMYLWDKFIGGVKEIPHGKAFDFASEFMGLLNGIPESEENIDAVRHYFLTYLKEYEGFYTSGIPRSTRVQHTIENLGGYVDYFPVFKQESIDITYHVSYPKITVHENAMLVISNAARRIRVDSSRHWVLIRQNDGIPTAYADMNFASYINPSSLPTLVKLASDIDKAMDADGYALIEVNELVKWINYPPRDENGIYKAYAQVIVEALKKMGYGIAPNPNEGERLMFGAYCCLFKLVDGKYLSNNVQQGQVIVKMASQVAMADGITTNDFRLIESALSALGFEGNTLKYEIAFAKSYSSQQQKFYSSKQIQELKKSEIPSIYNLLLRMTFNGGDVSTERVKVVKKYCKYLGQEPERIHSGIHEAMTTDEFAIVEKTTGAVRYAIPAPGSVKHKFAIDTGKLEKMERQTEQAQAMLSDIFVDEEQLKAEKRPSGENEPVLEILSQLLEKEVWSLAEVDELCKAKGLMTGFVLEKINDFSYEKVDDAVLDQDGDQIYVTTDYKEQLI